MRHRPRRTTASPRRVAAISSSVIRFRGLRLSSRVRFPACKHRARARATERARVLCEEGEHTPPEGRKEPASHLLPLLPHRHRAGASRHLAGWRPETPAASDEPASALVSAGGPELAESEGTHVKKTHRQVA